MTPELADATSLFDECRLGLCKGFLELWMALRDLEERSPGSVLVPQVNVERVAGIASLDSVLRFVAGVYELVAVIDDIDDRHVVAAKASLMRYSHGLCEALARIEREVGGENL